MTAVPGRRLAALLAMLCGCASLHKELVAMSEADQKVRQELIAAGLEHPDAKIAARMANIDARNTARIKAVILGQGWPKRSAVGEDGATAAFLLVQHADQDPDFQRQALPLLRAAYEANEASAEHLALLTDRVLAAEGKPQLYGTQADIDEGKIVVKPVEDPGNLDKRRAELGLPPMAEYLELMRKVYRLP